MAQELEEAGTFEGKGVTISECRRTDFSSEKKILKSLQQSYYFLNSMQPRDLLLSQWGGRLNSWLSRMVEQDKLWIQGI